VNLRRIGQWLPCAIVGLVLLSTGCATKLYRCPTKGMLPTMYAGDIFRAELDPYDGRGPARGDIVVFKAPPEAKAEEGTLFVKRVVGLAGELIEMDDFRVFINGQELAEPYALMLGPDVSEKMIDNLGTVRRQQIPPGHYFLMGDNRTNSYDSRAFGPVPLDVIVARALMVMKSAHEGQKGKDLTSGH